MDYSTDSLRTFVAVCEFKSFSLATSRVHKSQGAISAQVAKLEQQAGLKLIDRSQRPFRLTDGGELLLKFAKDIRDCLPTNASKKVNLILPLFSLMSLPKVLQPCLCDVSLCALLFRQSTHSQQEKPYP